MASIVASQPLFLKPALLVIRQILFLFTKVGGKADACTVISASLWLVLVYFTAPVGIYFVQITETNGKFAGIP
jgi:hypothetical protein